MAWILVTGASQNLGAAIVHALAAAGHHLVVHARTERPEIQQLIQDCVTYSTKIETFFGDVTHRDFISQYKEKFPDTKGLVYNIGNFLLGPPSQISQGLEVLMAPNVLVPIALTEALLPSIKTHQGRIVHLGVTGLGKAWMKAAAYGLTKESLLCYVRSLAKEVASEGVTVNMVSPGYLPHSVYVPSQFSPTSFVPNEKVAGLIAYLFSKQASHITGQNLEVAAGVECSLGNH